MALPLAACALILLFGLIPGVAPAAGPWWDFLLATGYCSLCLLGWLGWDSESPARQPRLRLHRNAALLAASLAGLHTIGLLLLDETVLEYLLPTAPYYMLAGSIALLALLIVTVSSLNAPRRYLYTSFPGFRFWHRTLFLVILGTSLWHVLGTEFILAECWQVAPVALAAGGLPAIAYLARRFDLPLPRGPEPGDGAAADRQVVLALPLLLAMCLAFAWLKEFGCATC